MSPPQSTACRRSAVDQDRRLTSPAAIEAEIDWHFDRGVPDWFASGPRGLAWCPLPRKRNSAACECRLAAALLSLAVQSGRGIRSLCIQQDGRAGHFDFLLGISELERNVDVRSQCWPGESDSAGRNS